MPNEELSLRIRFRAVRENLIRVRALVETFLSGAPVDVFSAEDTEEIVLALQECLSNAARHAHADSRDATAQLSVTVRDGCFHARLRDSGRPFDPSAVPIPDPERPREGGYGIYLLRTTMDDVRWCRLDGQNQVEFERRGTGDAARRRAQVTPV